MSEQELKPCPDCGEVVTTGDAERVKNKLLWFVRCGYCGYKLRSSKGEEGAIRNHNSMTRWKRVSLSDRHFEERELDEIDYYFRKWGRVEIHTDALRSALSRWLKKAEDSPSTGEEIKEQSK